MNLKSVLLLFACLCHFGTADLLDQGNKCVVEYLKEKKLLEQSFPAPEATQPISCSLALRFTLPTVKKMLSEMIKDKEGIKEECVKEKLESSLMTEYVLMEQVVETADSLSNLDREHKITEVKAAIKNILHEVASDCDSDPAYAGVFDNYLSLKNETLEFLQQDYCNTKYSIDNGMLQVGDININPGGIDTAQLNCDDIIEKQRRKAQDEMDKKFRASAIPERQRICVINKFKTTKMFEKAIAIAAVEKLDIPFELKNENKNRLLRQLEDFSRGLVNCVLGI